jgi:hypothetical protein
MCRSDYRQTNTTNTVTVVSTTVASDDDDDDDEEPNSEVSSSPSPAESTGKTIKVASTRGRTLRGLKNELIVPERLELAVEVEIMIKI